MKQQPSASLQERSTQSSRTCSSFPPSLSKRGGISHDPLRFYLCHCDPVISSPFRPLTFSLLQPSQFLLPLPFTSMAGPSSHLPILVSLSRYGPSLLVYIWLFAGAFWGHSRLLYDGQRTRSTNYILSKCLMIICCTFLLVFSIYLVPSTANLPCLLCQWKETILCLAQETNHLARCSPYPSLPT